MVSPPAPPPGRGYANPPPARGFGGGPVASGLNVIAGLWLIISPWVLRDTYPQAYWNDVLVGIAIVILAGLRAYTAFRPLWLTWLTMILGAWLIIASSVLNVPVDHANELIVGIVVIILGWWSLQASGTGMPFRQHGFR